MPGATRLASSACGISEGTALAPRLQALRDPAHGHPPGNGPCVVRTYLTGLADRRVAPAEALWGSSCPPSLVSVNHTGRRRKGGARFVRSLTPARCTGLGAQGERPSLRSTAFQRAFFTSQAAAHLDGLESITCQQLWGRGGGQPQRCKGERCRTRKCIGASGTCVSWGGIITTTNKSSSRRVSTKWTRPLETAPRNGGLYYDSAT